MIGMITLGAPYGSKKMGFSITIHEEELFLLK